MTETWKTAFSSHSQLEDLHDSGLLDGISVWPSLEFQKSSFTNNDDTISTYYLISSLGNCQAVSTPCVLIFQKSLVLGETIIQFVWGVFSTQMGQATAQNVAGR